MHTQTYTFQPLNFERLAPDEQLARSREFLAQMRSRRTVRDFSREPVPFELIENAIATAGTAHPARTSSPGHLSSSATQLSNNKFGWQRRLRKKRATNTA